MFIFLLIFPIRNPPFETSPRGLTYSLTFSHDAQRHGENSRAILADLWWPKTEAFGSCTAWPLGASRAGMCRESTPQCNVSVLTKHSQWQYDGFHDMMWNAMERNLLNPNPFPRATLTLYRLSEVDKHFLSINWVKIKIVSDVKSWITQNIGSECQRAGWLNDWLITVTVLTVQGCTKLLLRHLPRYHLNKPRNTKTLMLCIWLTFENGKSAIFNSVGTFYLPLEFRRKVAWIPCLAIHATFQPNSSGRRARDTTCVARTLPEICWKPVLKLAQVLARRGHVHVDVTQRLVDNKPLEGVGYPPSSTLLWHIPVTHTPIPYRPTCSIPSPACQPRESRRRSSWKGTSETKILGKKCRQGEQNVVKYGYFQGEHG